MTRIAHPYDKIVYLLQGGGALGSYQAGVCHALLEQGIGADWLVGTSIGAINATIIAGNKPENRIAKLKEFWKTIASPLPFYPIEVDDFVMEESINSFCAQSIALFGLPGFFKPRSYYPWLYGFTTPDNISFYDTSELRETLLKLIDFDLINQKHIRLSLGSVRVKTGKLIYFDNFHQKIGPEHVMASGALPPGFPAIKIGDEYYWDGGVNSNTPFNVLLQEKMPQNLLCFIVNLYSYLEQIPNTMMGVIKARKEIEYASRHRRVLRYFCELHYLQNTIQELAKVAADENNMELKHALKRIAKAGHPTSLNIVRFHYLDRPSDLWSKDYNFSFLALEKHWQSGYQDGQRAVKDPKWLKWKVGDSGAIIHEF